MTSERLLTPTCLPCSEPFSSCAMSLSVVRYFCPTGNMALLLLSLHHTYLLLCFFPFIIIPDILLAFFSLAYPLSPLLWLPLLDTHLSTYSILSSDLFTLKADKMVLMSPLGISAFRLVVIVKLYAVNLVALYRAFRLPRFSGKGRPEERNTVPWHNLVCLDILFSNTAQYNLFYRGTIL